VVGSIVAALWSAVSGAQSIQALHEMMGQMPPEQAEILEKLVPYMGGGGTLVQIVAAPVSALISIYLGSGIFHLLLMLFRGAPRGFDATLTTVAYAHGLFLLLAVPVCGSLIALVWVAVVYIIGLSESQRCGTGKAAAAVLLPAFLVCCCCGGAGMLGVFSLVKAFKGASAPVPVEL
jgi:hypothetical protein